MPTEEKIISTKFKHKGYFSMSGLYVMLYDMLITMGYTIKEDSYKQFEFSRIGKPNYLDINWTATKEVDDFTKFTLTFRFFLTMWTRDKEIEKDGAKIKTDEGDPEITMGAKLTRDYEGKWERNPFLSIFQGLYYRYLYADTYDNWCEKIREELNEIMGETKRYIGMF